MAFTLSTGVTLHEFVVEDVALLEKNLCDLFLKFGPGNFHYAVACLDGVPESRQIICYGISHFFDV